MYARFEDVRTFLAFLWVFKISCAKKYESIYHLSSFSYGGLLNQKQNNHTSQSQRTQTIQPTNRKSKKLRVADVKRWKTCAILVLLKLTYIFVRGFLSQSCVNEKPITFQHMKTNENRSIVDPIMASWWEGNTESVLYRNQLWQYLSSPIGYYKGLPKSEECTWSCTGKCVAAFLIFYTFVYNFHPRSCANLAK